MNVITAIANLVEDVKEFISNVRQNRDMSKPVPFKRFSNVEEFQKKYEEAGEQLESLVELYDFHVAGDSFGEVKVPGRGWMPCVLQHAGLTPKYFYDEDDGWQPVPKVEFRAV